MSCKEKSYPIPSSDGVNIDRGSSVMIVRYADHPYAFSMACAACIETPSIH